MPRPLFRTFALVQRGGPGLACDDDGLALGPVTLARKLGQVGSARRYRLLSLENLEHILRLAYGPMPTSVLHRRCRGVVRTTQLLSAGADALARIYAVLVGFPEIAPEGMAKLDRAESLRKYNPDVVDEPRVPAGSQDGGRWTSGGGIQVAAVGDLPCDGFSAGCQNGGSWGTTAMYRITNRNLCFDCAVKFAGFGDLPHDEQAKALEPFLLLPYRP